MTTSKVSMQIFTLGNGRPETRLTATCMPSPAIAFEFKRYGRTQHRAAGKLPCYLKRHGIEIYKPCQSHVQVQQGAEHKAHYNLQQLYALEAAAQNGHLQQHEDDVHHICVAAYGHARREAVGSGERQNHGYGGDYAAAQIGPYAKRDTERHEI